jgi:L-asparagine transporter-like permease
MQLFPNFMLTTIELDRSHAQIIALGGTLGTGLFVGSGQQPLPSPHTSPH